MSVCTGSRLSGIVCKMNPEKSRLQFFCLPFAKRIAKKGIRRGFILFVCIVNSKKNHLNGAAVGSYRFCAHVFVVDFAIVLVLFLFLFNFRFIFVHFSNALESKA